MVIKWPLRTGSSKKYQVSIIVHALEGMQIVGGSDKLHVIVKWKGPKGPLGSRFKSVKRTRSSEVFLKSTGVAEWGEEFENVCAMNVAKDGSFMAWPVSFIICKAIPSGSKAKGLPFGSVNVDLAEFVVQAEVVNSVQKFPVFTIGGSEIGANLVISVKFVELRTMFEGLESVHRLMAPAMACMGESLWDQDVEKMRITSMRKKGKVLKGMLPSLKGKKSVAEDEVIDDVKLSPDSIGKLSPRSDESLRDSLDLFDSDSLDDSEVDDFSDPGESILKKSFSYGTIAGANLVVEGALPFDREGSDITTDDLVYSMSIYSRSSLAAISRAPFEDSVPVESDVSAPTQPSVKGLSLWRKRKLSFRSPRARGEPLLNKAYGEEGGDEIDWDRRQSESGSPVDQLLLSQKSDASTVSSAESRIDALDFGEELFSVGTWERKEIISRDGHMKLSANVFFASFDQRSESAAGESACTALVAVIADWLHMHPRLMPSKAEFDMLIRDGSAEWRKLCEVEAYKNRFPDRHFDLDTVLQAAVRPLCVVPEKSFVGFFQPEGLGNSLEFLEGAMTFDGIWDEIELSGPAVYIVSWNDHFFVLRVEEDCCYIIDTLGERLYEGCNQAYILHFDDSTSLSKVPVKPKKDTKTAASEGSTVGSEEVAGDKRRQAEDEAGAVETANEGKMLDFSGADSRSSGRGACRQFVKRFFAALPLRELQIDLKKGLLGKAPLHQRLQIEFHFAKALTSFPSSSMLGFSI